MRRFAFRLLLLAVAALPASLPVVGHAHAAGALPAALPAKHRLESPWWAEKHRAILAAIAVGANPEVVLLGDSITQNYEKASPPDEDFQPTWRTFYAPRRALNLGYNGDKTDNVLWRLRNGEVDGLRPKVAILMIGTNDTGGARRSVAQVQAGIEAIVLELKRRLPSAKALVVGILPSAISPAKSATDAAINHALEARYRDDARVKFLDIGQALRKSDGNLDERLFYDPRLPRAAAALHPDTAGQRRMAEAIEPTLARMLGTPPLGR